MLVFFSVCCANLSVSRGLRDTDAVNDKSLLWFMFSLNFVKDIKNSVAFWDLLQSRNSFCRSFVESRLSFALQNNSFLFCSL